MTEFARNSQSVKTECFVDGRVSIIIDTLVRNKYGASSSLSRWLELSAYISESMSMTRTPNMPLDLDATGTAGKPVLLACGQLIILSVFLPPREAAPA